MVGFDGFGGSIWSYNLVYHEDWTLQEPEDCVLNMFHLFMTTWQSCYNNGISQVTFGTVMSLGCKLVGMEEHGYWQRKGCGAYI